MVTITKTGNAVQFSFDESSHYLYNGIIEVPVNSLSLTIDSSNMVTFRKAASNDAFLCITLEDLDMTKEEIATFFKEEMTGPTGGGGGGGGTDTGTVQSMINSSITEFYDGVQYDTATKHINFLHAGTVKGYVDATAFIKDGMVDTVVVSGDNLVITFNTDAGKEPIEIPLTDIFNPANYYTKAQTDTAINAATSGKADTTAMTAAISAAVSGKVDSSAMTEAIDNAVLPKADTTAVTAAIGAEDASIKTWVGQQGFLTEHQSLSAYSTTEEVASAISTAISAEDSSIKGWVADQGYLTEHQSLSAYSTTEEMNSAITTAISAEDTAIKGWVADQGYLTEHQSLSAYSTTDEVTADINAATSGKADSSAVTEEISAAVSGYVDSAEYDTTTKRINLKHGQTVVSYVDATAFIKDGMVDNVEVSGGNLVITFNTDAGKEPIEIPLTDIFDPANYYTTAQTDSAITEAVSGKQDTLTAGSGIDITNNVISVTGGGPTIVVDPTLDSGSTNPVANSVITAEFASLEAELSGKASVVTLTQEEYDQLDPKDPATIYIISDADAVDVYSKSQTDAAISAATSGKADTTAVTASINAAVSGKADSSAVTEEISAAVSGKADADALTAYVETSTLTAYSTTEEVTSAITQATSGKADTEALTAFVETSALTAYSTTDEVTSAITQAVSGKQDTLSAGTGIEISGNVISVTGGGSSVTVDPTLDSGSTNPVANSAITAALNAKASVVTLTQDEYDALDPKDPSTIYIISDADAVDVYSKAQTDAAISAATSGLATTEKALSGFTWGGDMVSGLEFITFNHVDGTSGQNLYMATINQKVVVGPGTAGREDDFELVEQSAFTAYTAATEAALSGKQDTLSAGTGIEISGDTINCTVTVDQTLDAQSTNAVSNAVVAAALGDIQTILDEINGD